MENERTEQYRQLYSDVINGLLAGRNPMMLATELATIYQLQPAQALAVLRYAQRLAEQSAHYRLN